MTELPDKTTTEIKTLTYDFSADLTAGITLATPAFTKSLIRTDAGKTADSDDASALDITIAQVIDQTVLVLIGGGLEGNKYKVVAEVDCSDGQRLDSAGLFTVRDSAA